MVILLIFRSFAREKKQEFSESFTIVLNLFAEIIVYSALFISVSMYQKMGIESNNAFFKTQGIRLYRYLCTFGVFLHFLPSIRTSWNGSSRKYLSSLP